MKVFESDEPEPLAGLKVFESDEPEPLAGLNLFEFECIVLKHCHFSSDPHCARICKTLREFDN